MPDLNQSQIAETVQRLGGETMRAGLADRLVATLDPMTPETRAIVSRRIVEFAEELADDETLGDVVIAAENPPSIGATELAARAGVSYRQVNYWTTEGYLIPTGESTGSGNPKQYPPAVIVKARIMGSLVRHFAMTPAKASEIAEEIVAAGSARVGPFTVRRDGRLG